MPSKKNITTWRVQRVSVVHTHTHTHLTADENEPNSTAILDNIPFSPYTLYLHVAPCVSQPRTVAAMTIDMPPPHSLQGVWAVLASDDKARAWRAVTHHLSARWTLLCAAGAPEACHLFFNSECQMIHNHIDRFTTFFVSSLHICIYFMTMNMQWLFCSVSNEESFMCKFAL